MGSFKKNVLLEQLGTTDDCEVKRNFSYYTEDKKLSFTIKKGFITDLDSIPPFLQSLVRGTKPRYWRAYILHDGLYRSGCVPRKKADHILDEALEVLGMGSYTRIKIYYPLRLFGRATTDKDLIENAKKHFEMVELN